jgi:hypothetical protein
VGPACGLCCGEREAGGLRGRAKPTLEVSPAGPDEASIWWRGEEVGDGDAGGDFFWVNMCESCWRRSVLQSSQMVGHTIGIPLSTDAEGLLERA